MKKPKTIALHVVTDEDHLMDAILEAMGYEDIIKFIGRLDEEVADWDFMRLVKHFTALAKEHEREVAVEPPSATSATNMDYARAVEAHGALDVAITISKAVSLIDVSKTARVHSGNEMGDAYLNDARTMLLGLIGIEAE